MHHPEKPRSTLLARLGWLAAFVATSLALSFGLACALPFAAFAALAAWRHSRRDALLYLWAVWLANQCIGFTVLHYPLDLPTLGWGIALGVVALGATWVASALARRSTGLGGAVVVFAAAFAVYEGLLWAITRLVGAPTFAYEPQVVARIFALNAATFFGLLAIGAIRVRERRTAVPVARGSQTP
jgi:hypothetical protein